MKWFPVSTPVPRELRYGFVWAYSDTEGGVQLVLPPTPGELRWMSAYSAGDREGFNVEYLFGVTHWAPLEYPGKPDTN